MVFETNWSLSSYENFKVLIVIIAKVILAVKLCQVFVEFLIHNVEIVEESEPEHEQNSNTANG